jgi:hypothetical protein
MTKLRMCAWSTVFGREPNTVLPSAMLVGRWCAVGALLALTACQPPVPPATPLPTQAPPPTAPPAVVASPSAIATSVPQAQGKPIASPPPAVGSSRVEVLNSANAASGRASWSEAAALYERVLNTPPTADEAAAAATAINDFAHFRAMVALLNDGREDEARAHVEALQARQPSAPLPRLADQFWNQYSMTASVKAACAQLQPQIVSQVEPVLSTLQSVGVNPVSLC